jgi:hypothetical protein
MLRTRDVPYYRRREEAELDRAVHADSNAARKAHLTMADMYRRELDRYGRIKGGQERGKDRGRPVASSDCYGSAPPD